MTSTPRDNNRIPMLLATNNTDGKTVVSIIADPSSHRIRALDGVSGSSLSFENSQKDDNRVSAIWGVSSSDGITPIPIYCDSTGKLLTQS